MAMILFQKQYTNLVLLGVKTLSIVKLFPLKFTRNLGLLK